MVAVLEELHLTELACSIDGLSSVGAATILAKTGDLTRCTSARAVVRHAGLVPRERMSGTFTGRACPTGAGRPRLRVAAWRAVWGCLLTNRVYVARYRHLTTRGDQQAHPGPDRRRRRDPAPAPPRDHPPTRVEPGRRRPRHPTPGSGCGITPFADQHVRLARGEPSAASRTLAVSRRTSQAAPSRRRHNPITRCRAQLDNPFAGTDDRTRAPAHPLTLNTSRWCPDVGPCCGMMPTWIRDLSWCRIMLAAWTSTCEARGHDERARPSWPPVLTA